MYLSLEGVGFCGGLYLPERGSLSLKAQLALSCMSQKSPRPGIGCWAGHWRPVIGNDWFVLLETYVVRRSDLGSQLFRFYSENPLWEIQQLFKGTRHDNRAQLVEGERSYFTPGAVYMDI